MAQHDSRDEMDSPAIDCDGKDPHTAGIADEGITPIDHQSCDCHVIITSSPVKVTTARIQVSEILLVLKHNH